MDYFTHNARTQRTNATRLVWFKQQVQLMCSRIRKPDAITMSRNVLCMRREEGALLHLVSKPEPITTRRDFDDHRDRVHHQFKLAIAARLIAEIEVPNAR